MKKCAYVCVWVAVCASAATAGGADSFESYRANLAAAHAHLRLGESAEARDWLDGADPDLRGWEWDYLDGRLDTSDSQWSWETPVYAVAWSPDGAHFAAGCEDGVVRIVDAATRSVALELRGHERSVYCLAWSPDGARIATASLDRTARVWNTATGEETLRYEEHDTPVTSAAWSPDGTQIATANYLRDEVEGAMRIRGMIRTWGASTGKTSRVLFVDEKPMVGLAWWGDRMAIGSWDGSAWLLDLSAQDGAPVELPIPDEGRYRAIDGLAASPDGRFVAVGSKDDTARVWDTDSHELVATLRAHGDEVVGVAFSPDGDALATGGRDGTVRLWRVGAWDELATLRGHAGHVRSIAFSPDGAWVLSGSADGQGAGSVRLWSTDAAPHSPLARTLDGAQMYGCAFTPDGSMLATSRFDGVITLLDAQTLEAAREWDAHRGASANAIAVRTDGGAIASVSWNGEASLWSLPDGAPLWTTQTGGGAYDCDISPDGVTVIASLRNGEKLGVIALDGATGDERWFHAMPAGPLEVRFSPDGRAIGVGASDGVVRILSAEDGSVVHELKEHSAGVDSVDWSPDGALLASAGSDGRVLVWDASSGRFLRTALRTGETLYRVRFSPDRSRIAAGGLHAFVISTDGSGALLRLDTGADSTWALAWSPDGRSLATVNLDQRIEILSAVE